MERRVLAERPHLTRPTRETKVKQLGPQVAEFCSLSFDAVDPSAQMALTARMLVFLKSLYDRRPYWQNAERRLEQAFQLLGLSDMHMLKIGGTIQRALKLIEERNYRSAYRELCTARPCLELEHALPEGASHCSRRETSELPARDMQAGEASPRAPADPERPISPAGSHPLPRQTGSLLFFRHWGLRCSFGPRRACALETPPQLSDAHDAEEARGHDDPAWREKCVDDGDADVEQADAGPAKSDGTDYHRYDFIESVAKLKNADTRVTKKGVLPIGEFAFTLHPRRASQKKGGSSFKASRGQCTAHIKCISGPGCEVLLDVAVGAGSPSVQVRHDFANDSVCIVPDWLDLRKAVDVSAQSFCVTFAFAVFV